MKDLCRFILSNRPEACSRLYPDVDADVLGKAWKGTVKSEPSIAMQTTGEFMLFYHAMIWRYISKNPYKGPTQTQCAKFHNQSNENVYSLFPIQKIKLAYYDYNNAPHGSTLNFDIGSVIYRIKQSHITMDFLKLFPEKWGNLPPDDFFILVYLCLLGSQINDLPFKEEYTKKVPPFKFIDRRGMAFGRQRRSMDHRNIYPVAVKKQSLVCLPLGEDHTLLLVPTLTKARR